MNRAVVITLLFPDEEAQSYVAECESDCRDDVDRFAYQEVVHTGQAVTVGCVVAYPQEV